MATQSSPRRRNGPASGSGRRRRKCAGMNASAKEQEVELHEAWVMVDKIPSIPETGWSLASTADSEAGLEATSETGVAERSSVVSLAEGEHRRDAESAKEEQRQRHVQQGKQKKVQASFGTKLVHAKTTNKRPADKGVADASRVLDVRENGGPAEDTNALERDGHVTQNAVAGNDEFKEAIEEEEVVVQDKKAEGVGEERSAQETEEEVKEAEERGTVEIPRLPFGKTSGQTCNENQGDKSVLDWQHEECEQFWDQEETAPLQSVESSDGEQWVDALESLEEDTTRNRGKGQRCRASTRGSSSSEGYLASAEGTPTAAAAVALAASMMAFATAGLSADEDDQDAPPPIAPAPIVAVAHRAAPRPKPVDRMSKRGMKNGQRPPPKQLIPRQNRGGQRGSRR
eukprot:TRINITY_DN6405_c0_g1_i2.p1 TRINITY_DN6405_c0_g1~~TRINITY_DN6405_c0_g1_i2.p1  ORF type:complete len:400 (+),score=97.60 TRINITY_DN6405_c0_g1_i2:96-1295(+)